MFAKCYYIMEMVFIAAFVEHTTYNIEMLGTLELILANDTTEMSSKATTTTTISFTIHIDDRIPEHNSIGNHLFSLVWNFA